MLRCLYVYLFCASLAMFSGLSMATGTDFTAVTSAIDFSTAVTAILALGALIAVALASVKGVRLLLKLL